MIVYYWTILKVLRYSELVIRMNTLLLSVLGEGEELFTSMESADNDVFESQVDWFQPDGVSESQGLLWIIALMRPRLCKMWLLWLIWIRRNIMHDRGSLGWGQVQVT